MTAWLSARPQALERQLQLSTDSLGWDRHCDRGAAAGGRVDSELAVQQFCSLADPDQAARKLIEIANSVEAVQDGRIHIEKINEPFLRAGGSPTEYVAGLEYAIAKGWLWKHESGVYVKFTQEGADIFS